MSTTNDNQADPIQIGDVKQKDHRDLSRAEALLEIGRIVGLNVNTDTRLGKNDLNSIHFYLTGEFHTDKQVIGTEDSPHIGEMRTAVAWRCGFPYEGTHGLVHQTGRPYRLTELRAIVRKLRDANDQRPFASRAPTQ